MREARRILFTAMGLAAVACLARGDALDDAAAEVDRVVADLNKPGATSENDRIFGDRLKKSGRLLFVDEEYSVLKGGFGAGWEVPEKPVKLGDKPAGGAQFYARWRAPAKDGHRPEVLAVVLKFPLKAADGKTPAKTRFADSEVLNSDILAMVKTWYDAWTPQLAEQPAPPAPPAPAGGAPAAPVDAPKDKAAEKAAEDVKRWVEPKKKTVGIAKVVAGAQGTVKATGKRERREWYAWSDAKSTYVVFARIDGEFLVPNHEGLAKAASFVEKIKRYE